MFKTITFFLIITFASIVSLFAQDENQPVVKKIQKIEQRLEVLEGQKENLDKQSEILEANFESKEKEINTAFDQYQLEINKEVNWIYNLLTYWIPLVFLGFGIPLFVYIKDFIKKTSKEKAEQIITERVADIIEENKEKIISLIFEYDIETRLKRESKILVILEDKSHQPYMEMLFLEIEILNVQFIVGEKYITPAPDIDLIIFDDHNDTGKNHKLFEEYLDQLSDNNMLFIFYGKKFNQRREQLNFANSKYTLYDRIMNSLKFRDISKRKNTPTKK